MSAHHSCVSSRSAASRGLVGVVAARVEQVESAAGHGLVLLHVADGVFGVGRRGADGFGDVLGSVGSVDMHDRSLRSPLRLRKRIFKPVPMGGGLGQAQAALAPKDAGQFLDQMLLGRPLRGVLGDERRDQVAIFGRVLPRQHGVARQDAMAQRVEAGDLGAADLGRQRGLGLVHFQKLLLPLRLLFLRLLVRASSRAR